MYICVYVYIAQGTHVHMCVRTHCTGRREIARLVTRQLVEGQVPTVNPFAVLTHDLVPLHDRLRLCLSIYLSVYLSICLSIYLSIYLDVRTYVHTYIRT